MVPWVPMKLILILQVTVSHPEGDGSQNYLLETEVGPSRQFSVSISTDELLPFKEGEWFKALVDMECGTAYGLDEIEYAEQQFPYGVPRLSYICNAYEITIGNKVFRQTTRRRIDE